MSTSLITLQRNAIKNLILTMSKITGYNFDWSNVNNRQFAIGTFPRAEVYNVNEECLDNVSGLGSMDYTNAGTFEIHVAGKMATSSDNPLFDIQDTEDKLIDDLKMLFGKNPSVSGTCDSFLYKGFKRDIKSVDQFTPRNIITNWRSIYSQDRQTPTMYASS